MATWGEFIAEIQVMKVKPGGMVVAVDQVMDLWGERNQLREEVARLQAAVAGEREGCAREVEEFAAACEAEGDDAAFIATALRAVAVLIRERGAEPAVAEGIPVEGDAEPGLPEATPIEGQGEGG